MRNLDQLWQEGKNFLGCDYSILCGAMSWVSERNLVSSVSNAGGFGIIACSSMSPDLLKKEILETKKLTNKPFGVNIIVLHPQMDELVEVCKEEKVSHIFLAGGLSPSRVIETIHSYGAKAISFAPSLSVAKRVIKSGTDAIIIEGSEAGGHIGSVSTSVLVQEIIPEIKDIVPVFVAGGIGRGELAASYLKAGASGVQLGTRFVCAEESIAHSKFKQSFIKASARDAAISVQLDPDFKVIPVRAIKNKATQKFENAQRTAIDNYKKGLMTKEEAQLTIEHFWAGALRKAVIDGDTEEGSLMAGQSVGLVKEIQSVKEIIKEIVDQAESYLAN